MIATPEAHQSSSPTRFGLIPAQDCCQQIAGAERELGAFLKAVQSLHGDRVAAHAADDWVTLVETVPVPLFGGLPDWRHITLLASSRLASKGLGHTVHNTEETEGNHAK